MADNTKMPPNQDQRPRTPGKPSGDTKPQRTGGPVPSGTGPDRDRHGVSIPGKQVPEIDPDRDRPDRNRPAPGKPVPGKPVPGQGSMDDDDDLEEGVTPPIDRE